MSDFEPFETALRDSLTDAAERTGVGTSGLAEGARSRAGVRRHRRRSLAAVVASVAVVAGGAVGLNALDRDRSAGAPAAWTTPTSTSPADVDPWRTVQHEGLAWEIPESWVELDDSGCADLRLITYGPQGTDGCAGERGIYLWDTTTVDLECRALSADQEGGCLTVPYDRTDRRDRTFTVRAERAEVLRILASVRKASEPAPDLSGAWSAVEEYGVTLDVPTGAEVIIKVSNAECYCAERLEVDHKGPGGQWRGIHYVDGTRQVKVLSAHRSLALMVAASARR